MFGKDFKKQRAGQPIEARTLNRPIEALAGLVKLHVGSGLGMKWMNGAPFIWALSSDLLRWYYTTSTITTASASSTGTALGSATLGYGGGTARRCKKSGTGTSATYAPDASTSDDAIVNGVVYTTTIATGSFCLCANLDSEWVVILVVRCPGT